MARIAGVNIPTNKRVVIALQYIHGIGPKTAHEIMEKVNIDQGWQNLVGAQTSLDVVDQWFPVVNGAQGVGSAH